MKQANEVRQVKIEKRQTLELERKIVTKTERKSSKSKPAKSSTTTTTATTSMLEERLENKIQGDEPVEMINRSQRDSNSLNVFLPNFKRIE